MDRRSISKVIIVNIAVITAMFLIFEAGLYLFWEMGRFPWKANIFQKSDNKILRYEFKPNSFEDYRDRGYKIEINFDGFRDKEYPQEKPQGVFRIVFIGDSEAFGRFLPLEHTIAKQLEASLNNNFSPARFEVINMGVEGYNSFQELEMLKVKGMKYNPDLVIVYYCFNDADEPEFYFKKNFLNTHSLTARYFLYRWKKYNIRRQRQAKGIHNEVDHNRYLYSSDAFSQARDTILRMADLTENHGIRLVLAVVPEMCASVTDFKTGYPFWNINKKIGSIEHPNLAIIDPVYYLAELNLEPDDLAINEIDRHKNHRANNIIADYLSEKLGELNLLS